MKKFLFTAVTISVSCLLLLTSCKSKDKERYDTSENYFTPKEIINSVYYENADDHGRKNIYISEKADDDQKIYIEKNKNIIKYCKINENIIAYHANKLDFNNSVSDDKLELCNYRTINSANYKIQDDYFAVFNVSDKSKSTFKTQEAFSEFCDKNGLKISHWVYCHGIDYEEINIDENFSILNFESLSLCQQITKNGEVIYEGFITDYQCIDGKYICFKIKIPQKGLFEFPLTSNNGIQGISNTPVGKQKVGPLMNENIYYEGYVLINISNDEIRQFENSENIREYIEHTEPSPV